MELFLKVSLQGMNILGKQTCKSLNSEWMLGSKKLDLNLFHWRWNLRPVYTTENWVPTLVKKDTDHITLANLT